MQRRQLGRSGLHVSAIGFGAMGLSEFYGPATDEADALRVFDRALELGVDFIDTSDMYGSGHNERLIAKAVQGRRERFVIATKFGVVRDPDNPMRRGISGRPEYVKAACDASLQRLGIDTIDLYYQHRVDPATPIEETVGAMAELVAAGKVRYLGLSEAGPETIRRACATHPIAALQTEYSLWERGPEGEILDVCRSRGVGFVAYSPLGRGFLSGQLKSPADFGEGDVRRFFPRFSPENFEKNLRVVQELEAIAAHRNATPAQLALAWVMSRGDDIVPIPGTTKVARLEENARAASIVLSPEERSAIEAVMPPGVAVGTRYPEAAMSSVSR